ncbi:TPA: phage tail tape measure C-terminal domain-containing protein [Salmonella enterica subsp. diarizonae]
MADDAQLGFSVDTSGLKSGETELDKLAAAATGATSAIDKLSESMKNTGGGAMSIYDLRSARQKAEAAATEAQQSINKRVNDIQRGLEEGRKNIAATAENIGVSMWENMKVGFKNRNTQRELGFMSHELMSGNMSRLRSSAAIFMSDLGMGGLAGTGLVMGVSALTEGIEALVDSMQEATQARDDMNNAAILSNNIGALYHGDLDNIIDKINSVSDMSKEAREKFITGALNSGLSSDFISKNADKLANYYNELGSTQAEAMEKLLAETQADATKGYKMLSTMGGAFLDKVNDDISSGKYTQAGADMVSGIVDGMQKQALASADKKGDLEGDGWFDNLLFWMGEGSVGQTGNVKLQQQLMMQRKERQNTIKNAADTAQKNAQQFINDMHKPKVDLSNTLAWHNFEKALHPSFATHHGLTDAEKAAKKAAEQAKRDANLISSLDTSSLNQYNSLMESISRRWGSKNQKFTMNSDLYDFQQSQDQINEQFDRMIANVEEMAKKNPTAFANGKLQQEVDKFNARRKAALAESTDGFNEYEQNMQSVVAGIQAGWIKYQKTTTDVATQSEAVFDSAVSGMTNSLTNFFTTGEAGWENYFKSIATMVEKYMVQDWVVEPLVGMMGKGADFAIDSLFGATSAATGVNGIVPDVPKLGASRGATYKLGALGTNLGTSPIQVTIYNSGNDVSSNTQADSKQGQDLARQLAKTASDFVKQQNIKSNRNGGINNTMGNWKTS